MYYVSLSGSIDLNTNLNGGATDVGITYEVGTGCNSYFSVNASTGVVTPLAAGLGVVLVKNASTSTVLRRVPVCVLSDTEHGIRAQLESGAITLAQGVAIASASTRSNSVYFDGDGDSLTVPSGAAVTGTGDYTVEMWARVTSLPHGMVLFGNDSAGGLAFVAYTSGVIAVWTAFGSEQGQSSNTITLGKWNHIAIARASGVLKIFINGVQGFSGAQATNLAAGIVRIGTDGATGNSPVLGHISSLRIVKGTALYTANFTPPAVLTKVAGTALLTCQQATLSDSSDNAYAVTAYGNAAVVTAAIT